MSDPQIEEQPAQGFKLKRKKGKKSPQKGAEGQDRNLQALGMGLGRDKFGPAGPPNKLPP